MKRLVESSESQEREPLLSVNSEPVSSLPQTQNIEDESSSDNFNTTGTALSSIRSNLAIASLALGSFAYGTNEFVALGFLPEVCDSFSLSSSEAGLVIMFSFMLGAAVSAPVVAMATTNVRRKYLLIGLTSSLAASAGLSAWSPSFGVLVGGRVLASLSQAAYMGVGSVVAASLVPKAKSGSAVALFFTGLTLANLAGVPLDTYFGNKFGWRNAFLPICGIIGLASVGQMILLPKRINFTKPDFKKELTILKKPGFWLAFATSAFGYCGMLASHTYFTNMMIDLAGYTSDDVTWLTLVYGAGTVIGNFLGGKAADKNLNVAVPSLLLSLAAVLGTFTVSAYHKPSAVISLFLNGLVGFSLIAPLMGHTISKAKEGPTLAASLNISAFGLGIALGIYLSGLAIDLDFGYSSPNVIGGSLTMLGFIFFWLGELYEKIWGVADSSFEELTESSSGVESAVEIVAENERTSLLQARRAPTVGSRFSTGGPSLFVQGGDPRIVEIVEEHHDEASNDEYASKNVVSK